MKERGFIDRDFLSTKEGFFFCIVGPYHPTDRVISYLKYLPSPEGKWRKGVYRFKRVMPTYTIPSLLKTFDLLRNEHPHYLFFSPVYNIMMTAVPKEKITSHLKPDMKLAQLYKKQRLDSLQRKVTLLVSLLSKLSAVPVDSFGVTGSILLDIHNPAFSDMDITVYGIENSYSVKNALTQAYTKNIGIRRFEGEKLKKWCTNKAQNHPISIAEAQQIYRRKWNVGIFDKVFFSVHPIKLERELTEKYGDKTFHPVGILTAQAVVAESTDSIFLPAVYKVKEVKVKGKVETNIEEVVSYEGLYDGLVENGEEIEVKGKLEHVVNNRTGWKYDRVVVGSPEGRGMEYIKPVA